MRRIIKMAGAFATIALAAGMTLAGTGVARADVTPPSGWSEIYSPYLNAQGFPLCIDDTNGSTSSGNPLQLYHCHGYDSNGTPQRWVFIQPEDNQGNPVYDDNGSPVYEIYNVAANLCLTVQNLGAGAPVTLGTCNRHTATGQIWWELHGEGSPTGPSFDIFPWPVNSSYGNCVAASNLSSNNNTRLVLEPCDHRINTIWRLG
jgi:hypothetical protein